MTLEEFRNERVYKYCVWAKRAGNKKTPKYIKKQAAAWLRMAEGKDKGAFVSFDSVDFVYSILKLMIHPDLHLNMYEGLEDYALFLITAVFCTKSRADGGRYYQTALLEIARKNFKTFNSAVIFIIAMLTDKRFSRFFSVAPDLLLSTELYLAISKIIKTSPDLCDFFIIKKKEIVCRETESVYIPLAYSKDALDGKLANMFLADETGALDAYPVEAMRSSQITLDNKLGIIISTQYPNNNNVFIDEVAKAKNVLEGRSKSKRTFALLYEPDENIKDKWQTDKNCLFQANPAAVDNKTMLSALLERREDAIEFSAKKENFLCKHLNIFYKGIGVEGYVDVEVLKKRREEIPKRFWRGKDVYLAIDLSLSSDNTAVMWVTRHNGYIYCSGMCFIPEGRVEIKSKKEGFDYNAEIEKGHCIACGGEVINYSFVERYILSLEREYGFNIVQIGYDPWNAISTVTKLEEYGYECVEIGQHSRFLHSPAKLLYESIYEGDFKYEENALLEENFSNARCTYDTNLNRYVNKKRSEGKVDMVVALINALYLLEQAELYNPTFVSMS